MRKLDNKERKTLRAFAGAALSRGEHKDDVVADVIRLLVYPGGWERGEARARAKELVDTLPSANI